MHREGSDQLRLKRILTHCTNLFDGNERYSLADSVIAEAIERFQGNSSLKLVLPKVMIVNSFYSTQIYNTEKIAKRILKIDTDRRLAAGDLTLVDDLRHGHGIKAKKTGKEIDFYSFATKYTGLHELTKFPMFDRLVTRLVTLLNKKHNFCPRFTQADLKDYQRYVSVIDALMKFTELESHRYKRFDQGIWIYAKYLYDKRNLSREEIESIMSKQ